MFTGEVVGGPLRKRFTYTTFSTYLINKFFNRYRRVTNDEVLDGYKKELRNYTS